MVFDCYRPARAVDDFVDWTKRADPPDPRWYPKVKRGDLIAEGYIGERSSHSRGSTVDVALGHIDVHAATSLPDPDCGAEKPARWISAPASTASTSAATRAFAAAGTPSPTARSWSQPCAPAGFRNYSHEWWHFTLENEPLQDQRFDFPVTDGK